MLPPAPVHVRAAPTAGELQIPRRFHVSPEEYTNLHITGLESNVTDLHLYQAFAGFGAISSVKAMVDLHGNCKGWGFVQFMYAGDAEAAIESTNGMVVGTKQWVVSHHKKKGA
jgi:polyadenylate-binding protein